MELELEVAGSVWKCQLVELGIVVHPHVAEAVGADTEADRDLQSGVGVVVVVAAVHSAEARDGHDPILQLLHVVGEGPVQPAIKREENISSHLFYAIYTNTTYFSLSVLQLFKLCLFGVLKS